MSVPNPATTDWVPLTGRVDLKYRGAYVPGNVYTDGDVAVYGGIAFICVRPTSAVPSPWGQGVAAQTQVGTYAARPTATSVGPGMLYFSTDTLGTWRSDGTAWTLVNQRAPLIAPAALSAAPFSTPYDGQEVILEVDPGSQGTGFLYWRFRYYAASGSSYKWAFVGGPPADVYVQTNEGNVATVSAWINLATGGPSMAVPRAGEYDVQAWCIANRANTTGGNMWMAVGVGDFTSPVQDTIATASAGWWTNLSMLVSRWGLASGAQVRMKYQQDVANCSWAYRRIYVTPVRIS